MHRFPANTSAMQPHPQQQPPPTQYNPQDGPPHQPYPPYPPPPPHGARRSNSPYVSAQGILPPPPTTQDPTQVNQQQNQQTTSAPATETTSTGRPSRKRKLQSPAPDPQSQPGQPHQLPPPPPPPHAYHEAYYTQHPALDSQGNPVPPIPSPEGATPGDSPTTGPGGRQLSTSKRAEQNRKAQRAFRERRDAHVKALESRSQLLDAALASADEANRRWEDCRALVDQLRVENAALRAALGAAHAQAPPVATDNSQKPLENGSTHQSRGVSVEKDGED